MDPHSLFSPNDQLKALSPHSDPLEVLERTVDFEYFRSWLVEGLGYGDGSKGRRPPFDPVVMINILIFQDRLSWMRFLSFSLGERTPMRTLSAISQPHDRDRHTSADKKAFDWQLHKKGYIPMSGQIVDASLAPTPKQRHTDGERDVIKAGKSADKIWPNEPAKAAQKDTDAR